MKRKYELFIMLSASALLTGAAVAFPDIFGIFEWASMVPLITALMRLAEDGSVKLRRTYLWGLFYFELFYMVCFHFFLYLYPLDFTGLDEVGSVLAIGVAWLGLPFLQALFGGFVFVVFVATYRSRLAKRIPVINAFSLAVIYPFYEFTQTLGWWGVPWGRLPIGQTSLILPVQTASLFGSYFITALIVLVNCFIYQAIRSLSQRRAAVRYAALALGCFAINLALGGFLYIGASKKEDQAPTATVGIVQGNYDSADKWFATPPSIISRHLSLTEACANEGAEVVIWAETALPFTVDPESKFAKDIAQVAKKHEITVLVGCMQYEDGNDYNSIICFKPDGTVDDVVYHKRHLVPFGEYVPMRPVVDALLPFLSEISMLSEDMTPGDEASVFDTNAGMIGSLICFDSIYEELARSTTKNGAELLAVSTNDSWFSDSSGIYMHNAQAKLRAIENGRYAVRSGNTGLSGIITSTGRTVVEIEPLTEGYAVGEVALLNHTTMYTIIGNLFVYILGVLILCVPTYALVLEVKCRADAYRSACDSAHNS